MALIMFGFGSGAGRGTFRPLRFLSWWGASLLLLGCNLQRIAADQTVKVIEAGSLGAAAFWDYEVAGQAFPGAILQGEALLRVTPDNEQLLLGMAKTYVAFAFGWLQNDWELADEAGEFERADHLEHRVRLFYQRATNLSLKVLRARDDDGKLDQVLESGDVEHLDRYLRHVFEDEEDAPALYYAGLAWGSALANSGGDLDRIADAPLARVLLAQSVKLDPTFAGAGGLGVLGTVEAVFPQLFGGDLAKAKAYFERALEVCGRRNHLILVGFAKSYAVGAQDRALFLSLLREVLSASDQGDDMRLNNKIARQRAERYIQRTEDWFLPTE